MNNEIMSIPLFFKFFKNIDVSEKFVVLYLVLYIQVHFFLPFYDTALNKKFFLL